MTGYTVFCTLQNSETGKEQYLCYSCLYHFGSATLNGEIGHSKKLYKMAVLFLYYGIVGPEGLKVSTRET